MFKTIDGELKAFNKTILSTQNNLKNLQTERLILRNGSYNKNNFVTGDLGEVHIAQPQTVSNFTKLNNAFNVYNNNLTKSTGLQNAYIKSVGAQNQALGNYLSGLNGTKASMGGYIASLISAKAATIGLQVASMALNMALSMGVAWAIGETISLITKLVKFAVEYSNQEEYLSKKVEEATDKIKEQQKAIDELNNKEKDAVDTYKEYASLMSKSKMQGLSTSEQEQLLSLSNALVDSYGLQVQGIDSLTGAYIIGTDAINNYVEALREERNEHLKEQTETRNERIDANIKKAEDYQKEASGLKVVSDEYSNKRNRVFGWHEDKTDAEKRAKEIYQMVKDGASDEYDWLKEIADEYEKIYNDPKLSGSDKLMRRSDLQGEFAIQASQNKADLESATLAWSILMGEVEKIENKTSATTKKLSATATAIAKDVLTNIKLDNEGLLNENSESFLTELLTPYFSSDSIDWDTFNQEDFEQKVGDFVAEYGEIMSDAQAKLKKSQEGLVKGSLDLSGYQNMYSGLSDKVTTLGAMRDKGIISPESYAEQVGQIESQISSNMGLSFAEILQDELKDADDAAKQSFTSIANEFINLENQFRSGSINSVQYLDELTSKIEDMDFTKTFGENAEAAQQFFATLTANSATSMQDTMTQFESGKISVDEYGDRMAEFAKQQKALIKQAKENGYADDGMEAQGKAIDEALSKWEELNDINTYLDENINALNNTVDTTSSSYQTFVSGLYSEFTGLSDGMQQQIIAAMNSANTEAGYTAENIKAKMGESIGATKDLATATASVTNGVFRGLATNAGKVLTALGNAIAGFRYTIGFEPKEMGLKKTPITISGDGESKELFSLYLPFIDYDIKGTAGEGSDALASSLQDLGGSLQSVSDFINVDDYGASQGGSSKPSGGSPSGGSGGSKGGSGGGGSKKDPAEEQEKKELEELKNKLSMREKVLERYQKAVDITDYGLDLAEEDDFALRVDLLNNKLSQLTSYGLAMREEFDEIVSIIPKTSEQAEVLASTIESLSGDMRENVVAIRETKIAMEQLAIDAMASVGETHLKDLENELDTIERRIELLNKDNGEDYQYTNEILSMKMFLPTSSSSTKSRNSKREVDQDAIEAEQETSDIINDLVETQIEKNKELREDERQHLLENMEQMRADTQIVLQSAAIDYENHGAEVSATTDAFTTYITNTINNMKMVIPKPDTSNFEKAADDITGSIKRINELLGVTPGAYASGTSFGNAKASDLGIAGENYKPEILVDKKTGALTYIDSPTAIDLTKTDVVGEKATAGLPMFAKGTIGDDSSSTAYLTERLYTGINNIIKGAKGYGAVGAARSYLNTPYVWGGTSRAGVDCSGLTYLAWQQMGVNIGRTTYDQYPNSTRVSAGQLRPGDLVFSNFGAMGLEGPGHVGMYIGHGRTIESPGTGSSVCISSLGKWTAYGRPRYATGTPYSAGGMALLGDDREGKLNKIRPELVITKHGARLVGTQGAEFVNLEKGDQVIPYDQTVEILKRSGKSVPRFATGTPTQNANVLSIIKKICDQYGVPYEIALSILDQESGNVIKLGKNRDASAYSHTSWQLYDGGGVWNSVSASDKQFIESAARDGENGEHFYEAFEIATKYAINYLAQKYKSSGSWWGAAKGYNGAASYADAVINRANTQPFLDASKALANNTNALDSNTSAIKEEKDPRKAKTEEVQKMADEYAERIGKVTLNGRALAQGIYNNKDLTNIEKTKQLYDVYKPMAKESAKIGSEMYATALESYNNWLKDVEADPSLYSKETDDAYRDLFADIEDYTYEYEERLVEMRETIVSNIVEPYERAISLLESRSAQLDGLMQNAETRGLMMSTRYYEKMKDVEQQKLDDLVAQRDELSKFIDEGVLNGDIEVGSSYWHELQNQVNGYTESIIESTNALAEHDNQMRQVLWDRFDYFSDSFSHLTDESNFLIELIGDNLYHNDEESIAPILDEMKTNSRLWFGKDEEGQKRLADANSEMAKIVADITGQDLHRGEDGVWYIDDQELYSYRDGQLSGAGMAVMGLRGMNYNVYMEKALSYAHELEKIENDIANNPNDINLIARKQELLELQREAVLAAEAEKDAIVALVEEGITLELESLQKLIDKYTESIEKTKSLYEYQEKLTDQTKDVAKIEKQLAAYENDDSEETRTKVQKLKLDLEKAQDNLKDTEYDKYINDQKKMLEDLYKYYEKALTQKLENTDGIVQDVVDGVNENANVISNVINRETTKVGASVSQSMGDIWNNENRVLKTYFEDDDSLLGGFKLAADGYFEAMTDPNTGVLAVLRDISTGINNTLEDASNKGKTEEESDFNKKQMIKNTIDWWGATDKQRENLSKENSIIGESMNLHIGEDGKWYDNDGDLAYEDPISNSDKIKALIARIRQNELDAKVSNDKGKEELEKSSNVRREQIDEILSQKMSSKEKNEIAQTLADIMNENSLDWSISDSGGRDTLSGMNSYIAGLVQTLTGKTMSNTNGVWTLDGESFLDKYGHSTRDVDIASRLSEIRDIIDGIRQNELDSLVSNDEGKDKLAADSASKKDKLSELIEDEYSDAERDRIAKVIVSRMERNVADWGVSDDNGKAILEAQNEYLAEVLSDLLKSWIKKDEDGVWKFGDEQLFTKYASGGLADYTGLAWLDGTPSKPELVLNAKDTQNFINLKDALEKASVQGMLSNLTAIPDFYNGALQNNSYKHLPISSSMGDVNFNIDIEHVEDYNDFVSQLQKDKKFERMIQSMSVDLLAGKSSLAKNKYKW